MKLDQKLRMGDREALWREYLGFLDLDMDSYMDIQNRLMREQMALWCASALGKHILGGKGAPETIEEFRSAVPLTTYDDYADTLLARREADLPAPAAIWIKTTWEGGKHPIKVAPYTQSMLDTYRTNMGACFIMFGATERGKFKIGKRILSGFAPLPYATGLMGLMVHQDTGMRFLPGYEESGEMSFSEKTRTGFKMAMREGVDYMFSMGSVAYCISRMLTAPGHSKSRGRVSPGTALRYMRAKSRCARENREMLPKDLFSLTALVCAGTDSRCYKDELERMWGVRPLEVFAGTEPTLVGLETWNRDGLYFFPDSCFYEFLPLSEAEKLDADPGYRPYTALMNEVRRDERYELIITVLKGGAFARYRTGDMYSCLGLSSMEDGTQLPRFRYIDRMPNVIDIAGFTRITQDSIVGIIATAALPISDWFACKEFDENGHPYLHLYVEFRRGQIANYALTRDVLREHLSIYFKYLDSDYKDLKRLLNMDPLDVSILPCGSFDAFRSRHGANIRRLNPPASDVAEIGRLLDDCVVPPRFYTAGGDD